MSHPGTVRVFDSLFIKPNAIAVEHACQMLLHAGDTVTFINEKVQKQIGSADCGLFALAFATDLCQGLDPTTQRYDQALMRQHYVTCLESAKVIPFPKTIRRVMSLKTRHWYKFFANVDCQMTRKNMLCALDIPVGITLNVCKYQIGQSTQRGNGNAKNVKITKH